MVHVLSRSLPSTIIRLTIVGLLIAISEQEKRFFTKVTTGNVTMHAYIAYILCILYMYASLYSVHICIDIEYLPYDPTKVVDFLWGLWFLPTVNVDKVGLCMCKILQILMSPFLSSHPIIPIDAIHPH